MKLRPWHTLAAALLLATACGSDTSEPDDEITVRMLDESFDPANVTVSVGQTVRWVNNTATAHTITPDNAQQPGIWVSQNIAAQANVSFPHTFNTAGVYDYDCQIHAGMSGRITVQ